MLTKDDIDSLYDGLASDESGEYQPKSGRMIYDELLISGMNILPISIQTSYITRGATIDEPIPASMVSDQMLVEGNLFAVNDSVNGWHFENNIIYAEPGLALQQWFGDLEMPITREYTLTGSEWVIRDYIHYGTDSQAEIEYTSGEAAPSPLPADAVKLYLNKLIPSGLLYPAQRTLYQIEEQYITKSILMDETVATNYFVNYSGSQTKLDKSLRKRTVNKSLPQGTELLQGGGSPLYDQVLRDEKVTMQTYLALMHLVIPDTLERVSGVAMRYSLTPQTNFVDKMRNEVRKFYALFNTEIEFEKTSLKSTTEINELVTAYTNAFSIGAIQLNDMQRLIKELFQL